MRDFKFDEDALKEQERELRETEETEREQQTELIRLARTNFGEMFSSWVHLKALRVFVESVLRFGLPIEFVAVTIAVRKKTVYGLYFLICCLVLMAGIWAYAQLSIFVLLFI